MPDIPEDPTQSEWLVLDLLDELNKLFDQAKKDLVKIIDPGETKTSTKPLLQQQLDQVDNIFKTVNLNGKDIISPHMSQSYEHGQMYAAIRLGHSEDDIQRATWKKVGGHAIEAQSNFKGLTDDVAKNVRRVIADGITTEQTVKQISKDIRDQVDTIGKPRADMIARTETMKAVNVGVKDKYRSAGIEVVRWLATIQPGRTCEECKALNGKLFPIDKMPPIPKHPRCRCTLSPVPDPDWSEVEGWDGEKVTPPKKKETSPKEKKKAPKGDMMRPVAKPLSETTRDELWENVKLAEDYVEGTDATYLIGKHYIHHGRAHTYIHELKEVPIKDITVTSEDMLDKIPVYKNRGTQAPPVDVSILPDGKYRLFNGHRRLKSAIARKEKNIFVEIIHKAEDITLKGE